MARTADGRKAAPEAVEAVAFCAFGALRVEALQLLAPGGDALARGVALKLAEAAAKHLGVAVMARGWRVHRTDAPRTVMEWNDAPGRAHAEVLAIFRQALGTATQRQEAA